MIRVVLDTNVVVSSLLSAGSPRLILNLALHRRFLLCISAPILDEYKAVLGYARLRIDAADAKMVVRKIRSVARLVAPHTMVRAAADPEDDRFLECAEAAKAHFLVTGNPRHFPAVWKYTRILTPRDFLSLWQVQKPLSLKPED